MIHRRFSFLLVLLMMMQAAALNFGDMNGNSSSGFTG